MEKAEEFYKRALEADPKDANIFCNYANFLSVERKDMEKAGECYKRALEADPKHTNTLGNYAQLLFVIGRNDEAMTLLSRAEALDPQASDIRVEISFYRLAHDSSAWPHELEHMAELLKNGARSIAWSLDANLIIAEQSGHPNPALLRALAGVISRDEPLDELSKYPEWPIQATTPFPNLQESP
jgi:tetratricopeptide (TPR) repeat protein